MWLELTQLDSNHNFFLNKTERELMDEALLYGCVGNWFDHRLIRE